MHYIEINNISKEFKVYKRGKGFLQTAKSLIKREYEIKKAVDHISLHIDKGEMVGYIGPNGAGKSTTIKMLTGILTPTSGEIVVDGLNPHIERVKNARRIGVVFGQRSQLYWDLPMMDTFELYKKMYRISHEQYKKNTSFLTELLEMEDFLQKPVRLLSLGQKMRANLAVALLHDPEILYLDEPTIGLDIVAKSKMRTFLKELNREKKTTVLLTTHDMDDIEQICQRVILIDKGSKIYDGSLEHFKTTYSGGYMLVIEFSTENIELQEPRITIIKDEGMRKTMLIDPRKISIAESISYLTRNFDINDLQLREPDIENAIYRIYKSDTN